MNMKMDLMTASVSKYHSQYCTIGLIMEDHHYCHDV